MISVSMAFKGEFKNKSKKTFKSIFQSKEDVMYALGNQMFFEDNPFEAVKGRDDLNGLQKIRTLLALNQSDAKRNQINMQAISILNDTHILAAAVRENRRVLTPLWLELLEEGKKDGSIKTEYIKELSELLPLINFWLIPSVFPATEEELYHKYHFVKDVLAHMGLSLHDDDTMSFTEKFITDIMENYGSVRRIDWRIGFMCGTIPVGKQCNCHNRYVAYYTFYQVCSIFQKNRRAYQRCCS